MDSTDSANQWSREQALKWADQFGVWEGDALSALEALARDLRATLSGPSRVPDGWKLVPIQPTQEMLDRTSCPGCAASDWEKMLSAVPATGTED